MPSHEIAPNLDRLLWLVDVDPMLALVMCAKWMGEDSIGQMLDANELSERFDEADADSDEVDYSTVQEYVRHGGAYDRGGADSYYGRPREPHYFTEATYRSTCVGQADMTVDEIAAYHQGYDDGEASGVHKEY